MIDMKEFFVGEHLGHCGDNICCLSAAIEFAEKIDGVVYVNFFKDVVEAYDHPRLKFGTRGVELHVMAADKHRNKHPGLFVNILGTYYSEFGLPIVDPELRLPDFVKCSSKVLLQPNSNYAYNPPAKYVQDIVNEFVRETGKTVYAIGNLKTPRVYENVDYSLLRDDVPFMMRQVQNAICVLTPRSFSANLAAGYHIPAFMWSPEDGEDWHLNYKGWRGEKVNFGKMADETLPRLRNFIKDFGLGKTFDKQDDVNKTEEGKQ